MPLALLPPTEVHSWRHAPTWILLSFAAGCVNAGALLDCQRFVSHVTGTATTLGADVGKWWLMLDYLLILASFVVGSAASVLALGARRAHGKAPNYLLPMLTVAAIVMFVAIAGSLDLFGPFGGQIEEEGDFIMLGVLSFAMGLQNATVATATNLAVRTTHLTGPATDFGVALATSAVTQGAERRSAFEGAQLRGSKIVGFIAGGSVMLPATSAWGYLAFFVPAIAIIISTFLSFTSARVEDRSASHATGEV